MIQSSIELLERRARGLVKPMVVLLVLGLSVWAGRRASTMMLIMLLGAAGAIVILQKPPLGLVGLVVASLTVPFSIGTGTQTSLNVTVLLIPALLVIWVMDMMRRQDVRLVPSRPTWPLLAFTLSATVSLIAGNLLWNPFAQTASLPAQLGGWAVFVFSAGAFLLVGNQITELRWLQALTWLFLGVGGLYIAGRVIPWMGSISSRLFPQGSTVSLFWVWLVALALGQCLFNRNLGWRGRLALGLLVTATLYVGWFQARSWASGWLPSFVAVGTIIWLRSWRVGLPLTLAVALIVFAFYPSLPARLVAGDQYSIDTRWVAWQILLNQVLPLNPILGLGPANYYHYTPLYPILGWYVKFNSHNNYVDILAQTGIIGFAFFAWFIAEVGWLGWRLRRQFQNGFAQGYVNAALGGLAGTLVACMLADWFLPFVYNIGLRGFRASVFGWLFLGGLVSLEQWGSGKDTDASSLFAVKNDGA